MGCLQTKLKTQSSLTETRGLLWLNKLSNLQLQSLRCQSRLGLREIDPSDPGNRAMPIGIGSALSDAAELHIAHCSGMRV